MMGNRCRAPLIVALRSTQPDACRLLGPGRDRGPVAAASGLSLAGIDGLAGRHGQETGRLRGGHVDREQRGSM